MTEPTSDEDLAVYVPAKDVSHFPEFAATASKLRRAHDSWWQEWTKGHSFVPPAEVWIQVRDVNYAFYDKTADRILLYLSETDIEDVEREEWRLANGIGAPPRKVRVEWANVTGNLLHEMMHEIQYKILREPTAAGTKLFETSNARFFGEGHDALFYTAIDNIAPCFGLTGEQFAGEL